MVSYMAAAHSMAVFALVLVLIQLLVVFVDDISIIHSIRGGSFVSIVEPIIHNGLLVCGLDLQHMKSIDRSIDRCSSSTQLSMIVLIVYRSWACRVHSNEWYLLLSGMLGNPSIAGCAYQVHESALVWRWCLC